MGTRVATGGRRAPIIQESPPNHSSSSKTSYRHRLYQHKHRQESTVRPTKHRSSSSQQRERRTSSKPQNHEVEAKTSSNSSKIPKDQLERIAQEILDQTKQLGLFDEVRMQLLGQIESSREFQRVTDEFNREVERFCSQANLSLPRSTLRDQLQASTFADEQSKLNLRLKESIDRMITNRCSRETEFKPLFDEQASKFLEEKQYVIERKQQHISDSDGRTQRLTDDEICPPRDRSSSPIQSSATINELHTATTTGDKESLEQPSSSCSSHADSGFSITPPSCRQMELISPLKSIETSDKLPQDEQDEEKEEVGGEEEGEEMDDIGEVTTTIPTSVAMAAIVEGLSERLQARQWELPKGKLAIRYARRRERRIKRKENRRKLKAQLAKS